MLFTPKFEIKSFMPKKPLILVTNNDITAPGIRNLIQVMQTIGEVVVVAPDGPQSGKGHAITIDATLALNKVREPSAGRRIRMFEHLQIVLSWR